MRNFLLLLSFFIPILLSAHVLKGKIVGVSDGDTVMLLDSSNTQYKIRLDEIDAPESGQAYGKRAKEYLSDLIFGKIVTIEYTKKDRYKRILGIIYLNDKNINEEMVKAGYAWRYYYNKSDKLLELQNKAKAQRKGLWRDKNAIDPYLFRKSKKKSKRSL